ncbi:hypothetical protein OHA45_13330 [Streptomyces lydicus]|uniref:Pepco domain-containing protein n=1 Tax=Streptomyces lydicus TaxID=47763 RepID=UPI002E33431E|nr:hypothetical protein [Streptomyces lydicus]
MTNTDEVTDELNLVPILIWDEPSGDQNAGPRYEPQARLLWPRFRTKIDTMELEDLKEKYARIQQQVNALVAQNVSANGWGVSEVMVRLGISAKGGLGFIAEAGVEAAIEVTFSRSAT